jgi:general stress protein YciG
MADNFNPADNLSQEARSKGGQATGGKNLDARARKKGGERSHGGGRKSNS